MKTLEDFIEKSLALAHTSHPIDSLSAFLKEIIVQPHWLAEILPQSNEDETLLHVSKSLTIYTIKLPSGMLYPPHSHGMPVVIGFYEGCETNLIYQNGTNGDLTQTERLDFNAPCVGVLQQNTIHAITNYGETTSRAIHYYLGDLINEPRYLWNPDSKEKMIFDNSKYFEFAKPNN